MIILAALIFRPCIAQYWRPLGGGTHGATWINSLYCDTVFDRLLAGGSFESLYNTDGELLYALGQAAWDGNRWDTLAKRIQEDQGNVAGSTYWFSRFDGELYACGDWVFLNDDGVYNWSLARLNASAQQWEDLGCVNPIESGLLTLVPHRPSDKLYATGYYGSLCGYPEACVFQYVDGGFEPWPLWAQIPYDDDNYVGTVIEYRGKTYMSGAYRDPNSDGWSNFMRFNGTTWENVPGWNPHMGIKDIAIHNDTLYVAGAFRTSGGAPGNGIARFDGENWDDMGGGVLDETIPVSTVIRDMEWLNGELWVCGGFTSAGGVPAECLAKWNGRQWCTVAFDQTTVSGDDFGYLSDMAVWRDSLYLCGGFGAINGEPIRHVAQWLGGDAVVACSPPVGLPEAPLLSTLRLAPNPAAGTLRLSDVPTGAVQVRVSDALGRAVLHAPMGSGSFEVAPLRPGAYIVHALDAQGRALAAGRFVRE